MNNTMSIINEMPSTKDQCIDFFHKLKMEVLSGNNDPIHFAVQISAIESVLKNLRADKEIKEYIVSEIQKFGKETSVNGNAVSVIEAGVKYDYQGDEKLEGLLLREKAIKLKIKARQEELKAGLTELPAIKSSTTTYKITLK